MPVFRSLPRLALAAAFTVVACAFMYYLPQRWHVGSPSLLPFTWVDRALPFWPLSGLVYFAVFGLLAATFAALRSFEAATRFLYATLLAQCVGMAVFVLWPTLYPREAFALPADAGPLATALVDFCRGADRPVNCLPSLHVSTVVICLATLRHCTLGGRRAMPQLLGLLAGLAMSASTLTFKQHYLVDALTGAALGYESWWVCFRWRGLPWDHRDKRRAVDHNR
jgi:membrane-associated phospholipid phosphatase